MILARHPMIKPVRRLRRWADQDGELVALWAEHDAMDELLPVHEIGRRLKRTESAVFTRAKMHGLSLDGRAPTPRRANGAALRVKLKCLCCGKPFLSENRKTNRICEGCKETGAWASGGDFTLAETP
ncbi:MAG: hypothetical protein V3T02_10810 [Alphaproteobacteria bacterium]